MKRAAAITLASIALAIASASACKKNGPPPPPAQELIAIPATPRGLPELPPPPADNPTTLEKVVLGRMLFFDERLSLHDDMACTECHKPDHGWSTTSSSSVNALGGRTRRKSMSVLNAGYSPWPTWDGRVTSIEGVARIAWTKQLGADPPAVAKKLAGISGYGELFQKAFGQAPSEQNILWALGAFVRALRSGDSPYDRGALSDAAARGQKLFESLGCNGCHSGARFTDDGFHDCGVGLGKTGPELDLGRGEFTKKKEDEGKFRTPSLRDVARSSPYFHDGSAATLADAVRFMAKGGAPHEGLDEKLKTRETSDAEVADLVAFLGALSGTATIEGGPPGRLPGK